MRALLPLAIVGGVFATVPAFAQDVEVSYGLAGNVARSDGDTTFSLEGEVSATYKGFFAGIWAETIDGGDYDADLELSAGYTTTMNNVDLTLTYTAYFQDFDYDTQDLEFAVGVPVSPLATIGAAAAYNLVDTYWDLSVGVEVTPMDKVTVAALIGDDGTGTYWEAGVSYDVTDTVFVGALYEDNDYEPETFTFTVGFAF